MAVPERGRQAVVARQPELGRLHGRGGQRGTKADRRAEERVGDREHQEDREARGAQQGGRVAAAVRRRLRRGRQPVQAGVPDRAVRAQLIPAQSACAPAAPGTGAPSRAHRPPARQHPIQSSPVEPGTAVPDPRLRGRARAHIREMSHRVDEEFRDQLVPVVEEHRFRRPQQNTSEFAFAARL